MMIMAKTARENANIVMRESDFESGVERYLFQYNGYLFDSETFERVDGVGARL